LSQGFNHQSGWKNRNPTNSTDEWVVRLDTEGTFNAMARFQFSNSVDKEKGVSVGQQVLNLLMRK
jgi:hypothetical protein